MGGAPANAVRRFRAMRVHSSDGSNGKRSDLPSIANY
jgi:hypothetical protein